MKAGRLRTLVDFSEPSEADDGYGGKTVTWPVTILKVPCQFRSTSAREEVDAGQLAEQLTAVLRLRARAVPGIKASWKATIDGVDWNIRQVIPFGQRGHELEVIIEKGGAV